MHHPPSLPTLALTWEKGPSLEEVRDREWLVTNGLGGYASGTLSGLPTRRYHGYFVPALPAPAGRTVVLARLGEEVATAEVTTRLDAVEHADGYVDAPGLQYLRRFQLNGLIPEWEYALPGATLHKRVFMVHGQNTVHVMYRNAGPQELRLRLRPWWVFRFHDKPLPPSQDYPTVRMHGPQLEFYPREEGPPVRTRVHAPCSIPFVGHIEESPPLHFHIEQARGYEAVEQQRSPGYFGCSLRPGETMTLSLTVGDWEALELSPDEALELELQREVRLLEKAGAAAQGSVGARLVLAADQFIIEPWTRPGDEAYARARGRDARSVIAGYHWFTDWGRDTMISLEGLTLCTGREREAAAILRTFCHHVRDGLLPNLFPEGEREGLYHTADATMWLFHAVNRYYRVTKDEVLLRELFPVLEDIIDHHQRGTRFGIGVDEKDGLLRQGAPGYQLTWMDAKVDGWVVTPRRGKAVEINALWYNALRLMSEWAPTLDVDNKKYLSAAEKAQASFNRRFWNEAEGCLYDLVDGENGDDAAVRPNQVFALSLDHPVLRRDHWAPVIEKVRHALLTPVGLRTLSDQHPDYKPKYDGDLRARDAAYHQGTVWPWLLGHYVDAVRRVNDNREEVEQMLQGLEHHLTQACVGQVSEIFDATAPYRSRGCVAQAWSVAELLRSWLSTRS